MTIKKGNDTPQGSKNGGRKSRPIETTGPETATRIDMFGLGVLNSLSAHIAVLDTEGKIIAINEAWLNFAKENHGNLKSIDVGSNYIDACLKAFKEQDDKEAKQAADGIQDILNGVSAEFEFEYPCHSPQQKRWFLTKVTPMRFLGVKAVVSHINITDRKMAEKSLFKREKEVSALNVISRKVSQAHSLKTVTEAILDQIAITIRPDLALLFLKEDENLLLNGVCPVDHPYGFNKNHIHKVGQCLCGLSVSTEQSIFSSNIHIDPRCTWEECKKSGFKSFAAIPMKSKNEVIGTLGIASREVRDFARRKIFLEALANDVAISLDNALLYEKIKVYASDLETQLSERKKMEKKLKHSQKMEAIGKLAGGIAHDFNNILTPILGYADLALSDLPEGAPLHDTIKEISIAGNRARDLIQQILTFSRRTENEQIPIHVGHAVMEAIKLLRSTLPSTIKIIESIQPDLAPIMGDATQIHQIVMNLCTNAAHAMEDHGGTLEVYLEQVYLDSKFIVNYKVLPKGRYLKLTISDTGHGMNPDLMGSIFEPYFTTKGKGKGTGLGLAVVHGIVKSHHGEITVYSEPQRGTTFNIYLPVIETTVEKRPEEVQDLPRGTECILYVDDETSIVRMGKRLLEGLGYTVIAKTQSLEALEAFKKTPHRFDLVITDMTMPNLRGDKLASQILEIRPDVKLIICTGFSRYITEGIAEKLGVKSVLMKPFTRKSLALIVRKAIDPNVCNTGVDK
ncbi:MAG: response regulator [Proteobacteria bacterium]|nr:response regulator [Pseudomonadota bacterium]